MEELMLYIRIIMTRKSGKHLHATYRTAVLTLLVLISSATCDLHHWRLNQQPQYAEAETLLLSHQFMSHISDTELTSHNNNSNIYMYIYTYKRT